MSNPDQAPEYDGEPTYAQDDYNEYLRWREETSHRPGELPQGPGRTYSPGPSDSSLANGQAAPCWPLRGPRSTPYWASSTDARGRP
jgi:hypothetical protein